CAMAADARLLHVELCAFLGGAAAGGKLLSRRTDRNIHAAEFFCGRRASYAIGGRLREREAPHEAPQQQRNRGNLEQAHWKLRRAHCSRSRPWRFSRA